jgi:XisH protein
MAKDLFHNSVKIALQKEGWTITDDPYQISAGNVDMLIDLGAENILAAERQGQRIVVEIKSFAGPSRISEFHTAHGQYLDYQ